MTGTLESNVSVTVDLLDGTAKGFVCSFVIVFHTKKMDFAAGNDYMNSSQLITFSSEAFSGDTICVEISIINDNDVECVDVFSVTLTSALSKVVIPSENNTATVTIEMDPADGDV